MKIGFHASHELHTPSELLDLVVRAEESGFDAAMCSDHISPWSTSQGPSGFAWGWLGAALQSTQLSIGCVSAPGYRYHPAVIAQAAATFAELYPGRFWVALGSGELLNEHVAGYTWPPKDERNQTLIDAANSIRRLIAGEEVSTDTGPSTLERARIWVVPSHPPRLYGAALSAETARLTAGWADGIILAPSSVEQAEELIAMYRDAGGAGNVLVQFAFAFAEDEEQAVREAHERWRHVVLSSEQRADLATPAEFDAATAHVSPEDVREQLLCSSDTQTYVEVLRQYEALGVDAIYLHNVCRDQVGFLTTFGRAVLPALKTIDGSLP